MGMFSDFIDGRILRDNPEMMKNYLAEQQSSKMAQLADQVYGQRGQAAQFQSQMQATEGPMLPGQERSAMSVNQQVTDARPGTGVFNQGVPEQQRMQELNKRMLQTGLPGYINQWVNNNTNMQNSAMSNLGSMARQEQKQKYEASNPKNSTAIQNYLYGLKDPRFAKQQMNLRKAGALNLGTNQFTSPAESKNLEYLNGSPVLPFTNKNLLSGKVRAKSALSQGESESKASAEVSIKMAEDLLKLGQEGMDLSGFEGWAEGERAGAGLTNIALNKALDLAGYTSSPNNIKGVAISENLSNTVLQALRGAAVGPAEQERVDRQLPRPGQPKKIFEQNIRLTIDNLKMIMSSKAKSRGEEPVQKAFTATSANGKRASKVPAPGEDPEFDAYLKAQGL